VACKFIVLSKNIFVGLLFKFYSIPMKERRQILVMGGFVPPNVSPVLSILIASIGNESGEWKMIY
jgi:hypothetical protein